MSTNVHSRILWQMKCYCIINAIIFKKLNSKSFHLIASSDSFPPKIGHVDFSSFLTINKRRNTYRQIKAANINFCRTRSSRYLISYNYSRITGKLYFKQNQPARLLTDLETASRFFFNFAFKNERLKELNALSSS